MSAAERSRSAARCQLGQKPEGAQVPSPWSTCGPSAFEMNDLYSRAFDATCVKATWPFRADPVFDVSPVTLAIVRQNFEGENVELIAIRKERRNRFLEISLASRNIPSKRQIDNTPMRQRTAGQSERRVHRWHLNVGYGQILLDESGSEEHRYSFVV